MSLRTAVVAAVLLTLPCRLAAQDAEPAGVKSPRLAREIALAGMLLPITIAGAVEGDARVALVIAGLSVGPAAAFVYAGEIPMSLPGIAIRAVTSGATALAIDRVCTAEDGSFLFRCPFKQFGVGLIGGFVTLFHVNRDLDRLERRMGQRVGERRGWIQPPGAVDGFQNAGPLTRDAEWCETDAGSIAERPLVYSVLASHVSPCPTAP